MTRTAGLCVASGLIRKDPPAKGVVAELPEDCRPGGRLIFNLNHHEFTARVDVLATGEITWHDGTVQHPWVSLDGLVFQPGDSAGEALSFREGWTNYGGQYRPAGVSVH